MRRRGVSEFEPYAQAVDAYVDAIRNSPRNKDMFEFFHACTPGYYNGEGRATKGADLFLGDRYGDGPLAFFKMLRDWRANGELRGLIIPVEPEPAGGASEPLHADKVMDNVATL